MLTALPRFTRSHHKLVEDNTNQNFAQEPVVVGDLTVSNPNTSEIWLQIFDALTGDVTVGSTVPSLSYPCPAGGGVGVHNTSAPITNANFMQFVNGFTYAITTTRLGSTAPTLDVVVNGKYRKG